MESKGKITYFGLPPNSNRVSGYSKWFFPVFDCIKKDGFFDVSLLQYNDKILNEHTGRFMKIASPYLTYRLKNELGSDKNIVHVLRQNSWFKELFFACKFYSKYQIVKIITVHDIFKEDGCIDNRIGSYLDDVDAIFCPSEFTKQSLFTNFKINSPIYVTYNPLDERYLTNFDENREHLRRVLALNRVVPLIDERLLINVSSEMGRKNIESLIQVVYELNKNEVTYLIKIGRPTKNREIYLKLAKKLNVHDKIIWVDWVNEQDLINYYRISDMFVTLSEGEGFCMPLIEAMACGLPIVAANATAIPEIIGEAGYLVDPKNLHEIVGKCEKVLTNTNLSEELSGKGRDRIKLFRSKSVAKRYIDAYLDIINR